MNDSWIIFCPSGFWQIKGIKEARKLGNKILSIDSNEKAEGFKYSDDYLCLDTNDYDNVINQLKKKNINIVASLSFCSDIGVELCAHIRIKFSIEGYSLETASNVVNKFHQRSQWEKAGLQEDFNWKGFMDPLKAFKYLKNTDSKKVLKPVDSSGSKGVLIIKNKSELEINDVKKAFEYSKSKQIIIEDFIDGKEYTVEVFYQKENALILAITEKEKLRSSNFTIANKIFTPNLEKSIVKKIKFLLNKAAKALGYNSGIAHIEIMIQKSGEIKFIEFSARGGGFGLNHFFVERVCGLDPTFLTLMDALKKNIEVKIIQNRKAVIKYIPAKYGKIKKIQYPQSLNHKGLKIKFFSKIGDSFEGSKSDGDRLGYVFCVSENLSESMKVVDEYYDKINVEYI